MTIKLKTITNPYKSDLYAIQANPSRSYVITGYELKKFIGILLFVPGEHFPCVRSCCLGKFGYEPIKNAMRVKRLDAIRSMVHPKISSER